MLFNPVLFVWLCIICIIKGVSVQQQSSSSNPSDDINSAIAPSDFVLVEFQLISLKILNYDDERDIAKIAVKARLFWEDHRLALEKDKGDATYTRNHTFLRSSEIWLPDFSILNNFDGELDDLGPDDGSLVTTYSNGSVSWNVWTVAAVQCSVEEATSKLHDKRKCVVEFGCLTYPVENLQLSVRREGQILYEQGLLKYQIEGSEVKVFALSGANADYSRLSFSVNLKKDKTAVERFHGSIILPCIALSLLILLQFLIPPNIGERVVYGILVLIFLTAFAYFVSDLEIQFGIHDCWFPTMLYIFALMLGAVAALTNTCLVVNFHHARHNIVMHRYFKKVLIDYLPKLMLIPDANRIVEREMSEKRRSTKRRQPMADIADGDDAGGTLLSSGDEGGAVGGGRRPTPAEALTLRYLFDILREMRELSREVILRVVESRGSPQWTCAAEALNRLGLVTVSLYVFLCHFVACIYYWTL